MASTNPVLSSITKPDRQRQGGFSYQQPHSAMENQFMQNGFSEYGANPFTAAPAERAITVDDVITKTGITLGVIVLGAIITYLVGITNPALAQMLAGIGAIGGLITVLVATFGKKYNSAPVTLIYAAFEGLFVGGLTFLFTNVLLDGANAGAIISQAVLGTIGVFVGMLFVYKTGAVKVTPKFTRVLTSCLIGVVVLALGNIVLGMFTGSYPLTAGGPVAIIFSLVCIGLAAMSFLQDFNAADQLVRSAAPASMAWGVALGLAVTLVWLYTEILRLLSYFRNSA